MRTACIMPCSLSEFRVKNQPDYIIMSNLLNISSKLNTLGLENKVFDFLTHEGKTYHNLLDQIIDYNPDILCLCANFCLEDLNAFLLDLPKELLENAKVICFGTGVMDYQMSLKKNKQIDYIVPSFPENIVCQLINNIASGSDKMTEMFGVAYRSNGEVIFRRGKDDNLSDALKHTPVNSFISNEDPHMAYLWASRGCWYGKCVFCNIGAISDTYDGLGWNARNIDDVVEDIVKLKRQGISIFHFLDSEFIGTGEKNKKRVQYFAKEIIRRQLDINFMIDVRVDNIDYETFKLLKEAGVANIFVGIESGSEATLKKLNKGYNLEQVREGVKILRDLGIRFKANFMLAHPESTIDEIEKSLQFIKEMKLLDSINQLGVGSIFHQMHLHAGTPIYNWVVQAIGKEQLSEIPCYYKDEVTRYFIQKAEDFSNLLTHRYLRFIDQSGEEKHLYSANASYIKVLAINGLLKILELLKDGISEKVDIEVREYIDSLIRKYDNMWLAATEEEVN